MSVHHLFAILFVLIGAVRAPAQECDPPKLPGWMGDPASVDRSEWELLWPEDIDTLRFDHTGLVAGPGRIDAGRKTFENVRLVSGLRTGAIYLKRPKWDWAENQWALEGLTFENFELRPGLPRDTAHTKRYQSGTFWGMRLYNVRNLRLENGWIHDIDELIEGHAIYVDPSGPCTFKNLVVENCGGQALQIVNREWDQPPTNLPHTGGTTTIENVKIRNVGFNPSRGAFAITMRAFGPDADVVIENADVEVAWDQPQKRSGKTVRSAGGITLAGPDQDPRTRDFDFFRHVTIRNCRVKLTDPFQALLQVEGCRSLTVENCCFEGGTIQLDPHGSPHGIEKLVWRNNTGDARVLHQRKPIGNATDEFDW